MHFSVRVRCTSDAFTNPQRYVVADGNRDAAIQCLLSVRQSMRRAVAHWLCFGMHDGTKRQLRTGSVYCQYRDTHTDNNRTSYGDAE